MEKFNFDGSFQAKEYGDVDGIAKMKAEIFHKGPIACGIAATKAFEEYSSGIHQEVKKVYSYTAQRNEEKNEKEREFWVKYLENPA